MKASELISMLADHIYEYGDQNVYVADSQALVDLELTPVECCFSYNEDANGQPVGILLIDEQLTEVME